MRTVLELAGRRLRLISTVNGRVWGFIGASSVRFRREELSSIPGGFGAYARAFKSFAERQNTLGPDRVSEPSSVHGSGLGEPRGQG